MTKVNELIKEPGLWVMVLSYFLTGFLLGSSGFFAFLNFWFVVFAWPLIPLFVISLVIISVLFFELVFRISEDFYEWVTLKYRKER